jgi:hypothetical protein
VVELDELADQKSRQDAVLKQTEASQHAEVLEQTVAPSARSRQLIVE